MDSIHQLCMLPDVSLILHAILRHPHIKMAKTHIIVEDPQAYAKDEG